jgi:hypothetical protein
LVVDISKPSAHRWRLLHFRGNELQAANDNIHLDEPLRLADAIKYGFPHGGMSVSGLRREAARGNLVIEKIANKDFTTLRAIEGMRKSCRVKVEAPACGGERTDGRVARLSPKERGLLSTVVSITPQDALLARIEKRKNS